MKPFYIIICYLASDFESEFDDLLNPHCLFAIYSLIFIHEANNNAK